MLRFSAKRRKTAMTYHQITALERYALMALRVQGLTPAAIPEYYARGRRSYSRRNTQCTPADWRQVDALICEDWSPEQIAGRLRRERVLRICDETIYRYIWNDQRAGGHLYTHLRCAQNQRRKRYGAYDSRGRLADKRPIATRPAGATNRSRVGHWQGDTMLGDGQSWPRVLTLVERKTGFVAIGKLRQRNGVEVNRRARRLIAAQPRPVHTITVDNGTEFHSYAALEHVVDARFYFATPHLAWERGTNENTNGLIRQYLPKRASMAQVTQQDCNRIATKLNRRPRKRLGYQTPEECYVP
jgi:IS30 family transposase